MIYIKEGIQCKQIDIPENTLECVGVNITLSPEMSFVVVVLYQPPTSKVIFFYLLSDVLIAVKN